MTDLGINTCMCRDLNISANSALAASISRAYHLMLPLLLPNILASTCSKFWEDASAHTFPHVRMAEIAACSSR